MNDLKDARTDGKTNAKKRKNKINSEKLDLIKNIKIIDQNLVTFFLFLCYAFLQFLSFL